VAARPAGASGSAGTAGAAGSAGTAGAAGPAVARSGRAAEAVTIDALAAGELTTEDIMISAGALLAQAAQAREHGYEPMARNFERAAEMTALPDDEILAMYEALRPFRSSAAELEAIAVRLDGAAAPNCAALVREAAEAYAARGCLRAE
jgi:propanediol dehydratase small subunit